MKRLTQLRIASARSYTHSLKQAPLFSSLKILQKLQVLSYIVRMGVEFLDRDLDVATLSMYDYNGLTKLINPLHYTRIKLQSFDKK